MRLRQYTENTELVYQPGQSEQSKIADDFYSFKYWREPLPKLDLTSILKEVRQPETSEPITVTTKCEPSSMKTVGLLPVFCTTNHTSILMNSVLTPNHTTVECKMTSSTICPSLHSLGRYSGYWSSIILFVNQTLLG